MNEKKAVIKKASQRIDEYGRAQNDYADIGTIKGVFLPNKDAIQQKDEGIHSVADYEFFYKGKNRNIKKGDRLVIDNKELYVIDCLDYGKALQIQLSGEIPNG